MKVPILGVRAAVCARRALVMFAVAAACVVAAPASAPAQSDGAEPPLDVRLRQQILKMPDHTKDPVVAPTEAERSQEQARRAPEGPGYIGPLSTETRTGRMGAAGWTSSGNENVGRATAAPHESGWAGFGFAIEWGGSPNTGGAEAP